MTPWRCTAYLCLLVFFSTIDHSKGGCSNYFKVKDWAQNLTDVVSLVGTVNEKDKIECTVEMECRKRANDRPTFCGILSHCFNVPVEIPHQEDIREKCNGSDTESVPFYHFMCLIAREANNTLKERIPACEYGPTCKLFEEQTVLTTLAPTTTLPPTTPLPETTTTTTAAATTTTALLPPATTTALPQKVTAAPPTATSVTQSATSKSDVLTTLAPTTTLQPTTPLPETTRTTTTAAATTTTALLPPATTTALPQKVTAAPPTATSVTQSTNSENDGNASQIMGHPDNTGHLAVEIILVISVILNAVLILYIGFGKRRSRRNQACRQSVNSLDCGPYEEAEPMTQLQAITQPASGNGDDAETSSLMKPAECDSVSIQNSYAK